MRILVSLSLIVGLGCGGAPPVKPSPPKPKPEAMRAEAGDPSAESAAADSRTCGGERLRVAFYDAGQALAALVTLPDGRHILVDAGESPTRPACGPECRDWHNRVLGGLKRDLGDSPIDMLWITHPHSDHLGGVPGVADEFEVSVYVDNGRDLGGAPVKRARDAVAGEASVTVIDPGNKTVPLSASGDVKLTAIVPDAWSAKCKDHPNDCSILLRIDYCRSSVLFTGDAEKDEEAEIDVGGEVTLLQVGHHGSDTSTTAALLGQARPKYAVISSGKPGEGTNRTYCHPRKSTIDALTASMGGSTEGTIRAFSGAKCEAGSRGWKDVPSGGNVWATSRDGDVVLTTTGDGEFTRE